MILNDNVTLKKIGSDVLEATILESGNICELNSKDVRINQLSGSNLEQTALNIYLRVENNGVHYKGMVGLNSRHVIKEDRVVYLGEFMNVKYEVTFAVKNNAYFFNVKLNNLDANNKIKVFYGFDIAVANKYAVRNNEAYVCQYVDHQAFMTERGYVVCSRENQGGHTYLEQGSISKNIGYSTDGFQFFGKNYKVNSKIEALELGKLENRVYQYEFGYTALESEEITTTGNTELCFYGIYKELMDHVVSNPELTNDVLEIYNSIDFNNEVSSSEEFKLNISFNNVFNSEELSNSMLDELYPTKKLIEAKDNTLLSFFTPNYSHVVLKAKEGLLERQSGQVLISGNHFDFERVLASTSYIYGLFSSQVVMGNTSFNKLTSNIRNSLNVQKISGTRMFVKLDGEYKLLGMPAVFEMGINYSKWIYVINNDLLTISTIINEKTSKLTINFESKLGVNYDIIVSNYLTMGQNEHEGKVELVVNDNAVIAKPLPNTMISNTYPDLYFTIKFDMDVEFNDDRIFYTDNNPHGDTILTCNLNTNKFNMLICGDTFGDYIDEEYDVLEEASERYNAQFKEMLNNFELKIDGAESEHINSFNMLAYWYTQNALVHYTSPHGLEQYNGAAWGTRDVCQGPAEYFLATQNFAQVRKILIDVFSHQYIQNGNWPQWFMFDRFFRIQQHESHGDIIVWPMRLLGLYLEQTKDLSILDEMVVYTDINNSEFTAEKYSILDHVKNEVENIVKSFIDDTNLSCYGGGDWDDTLQPANKTYASRMVSGWTTSLTYEALMILSRELLCYNEQLANEYLELANKIKEDYNKYVFCDGVPAGFLHFTDNGIERIIHPTDNKTNMKYRLLPMNRGIISELFTEEQKETSLEIINKYLKHPDGVRLMDKTVPYHGGDNTYFTRAETAANFGREIGLQYCHAHIRYCEALAKVGLDNELYSGLLTINPFIVNEFVKNAEIRQRNSYFSSSDGAFYNRYEAMKDYDKLRTGEIKVKAGWRVYSSGPGIYLNQLISNMLGLRLQGDKFILDPVLPELLNNLEFTYRILGKDVTIKYVKANDRKVVINGNLVSYETENRKYRTGGMIVDTKYLNESNVIEVYF